MVYKIVLVNKSIYIDDLMYKSNKLYWSYVFGNLNFFLSYYYWYDNHNSKNLGNTNLRERIKHLAATRSINYRGFKIHCLGRFSRKQRSSSIWFSIGRVPLNTMNCIIDYGYYTIPIINSAIMVKVWIHKNFGTYWFMRLN